MLTRRHFVLTGCAACVTLANARITSAVAADRLTAQEITGPGYVLRFINSMREVIMTGKRDALLDIATLKGKPHIYGLGPIAGLTGEVTIVDSRSVLARVGADHQVHVTESYDVGVPFFVWAEVPVWQTIPVPPDVTNFAELEKFIGAAGAKVPFKDAAFPFVVTGQPKRIDYHVVNAKSDTPAGMVAHQEIQIPFQVQQSEVTLVGFWSNHHQGIFTPMGSNMHVHFQTTDNSGSGHVQSLELAQNKMTLSLPKPW